jgi:rhodanese-related sulfurtransferase
LGRRLKKHALPTAAPLAILGRVGSAKDRADMQAATIACADLAPLIGSASAPILIDVRRAADFEADPALLPGSFRGDPEDWGSWAVTLPPGRDIVVYCVHGRQVSQDAAEGLRRVGLRARHLTGGIAEWRERAGPIVARGRAASLGDRSSAWITRERPKIDRIACPWLVRRFIDPRAVFLYVPEGEVAAMAAATGAVPYDVSGAELGHHGERCSFDAFIAGYAITDPALALLADIVRGADTGRPDLTPQSAGLLAMSHGLSILCSDDHAMLEQGMLFYDTLYAWCRGQAGPVS